MLASSWAVNECVVNSGWGWEDINTPTAKILAGMRRQNRDDGSLELPVLESANSATRREEEERTLQSGPENSAVSKSCKKAGTRQVLSCFTTSPSKFSLLSTTRPSTKCEAHELEKRLILELSQSWFSSHPKRP